MFYLLALGILLLQGFVVNRPLPDIPVYPGLLTRPISVPVLQASDPFLHADTPTCSIPFTLAGKLILVKGHADSTVGNFIFDTGAQDLVLNSTYFRDYNIDHSADETQQSITGQGASVQRTTIKLFRLGTFKYYQAEAQLVSLRHIEDSRGVKILGLLGVSMFKDCEIIIDYKNSLIHLHHISKKERKTYQHALINTQSVIAEYPFDLVDNRILVSTSLNGKKLPFVVDFAAESNIIDSRLPNRILDSIQVSGRVMLTGAGSRKVEALTGHVKDLKIGNLPVSQLPVIVTNLEGTCFGKDVCINGVLGYEFLSRYTLAFNFAKRRMYILQ